MSITMRVLHLDNNHDILVEGLSEIGCTNDFDFTSSKEDILSKIDAYDAIVIRSRFPIDKAFLDSAKPLRFIARVGSGLENIDVSYAKGIGIEVIASPEGNANAVGEHALGMILTLFNKLPKAALDIKNGKWEREANRGEELNGKTIGLIGYGHTANQFAKKLSGFDVTVLCHDILPNKGNAFAQQVDLKTLQEQADVVSLHIPQTAETKGLIDDEFIKKMSKEFWLINTARGNQVVIKDLIDGLEMGKVRGACLDVLPFEKSSFEGVTNNAQLKQLQENPNVILTPHIAGWTHQSKRQLAQVIVGKVKQVFFNSL